VAVVVLRGKISKQVLAPMLLAEQVLAWVLVAVLVLLERPLPNQELGLGARDAQR
jgi:hypothetical protein